MARLGLNPRLISKVYLSVTLLKVVCFVISMLGYLFESGIFNQVANDPQGKGILEELEADGVDSSFIVARF